VIARGVPGFAVAWEEGGALHPSINRLWSGLPEVSLDGAISLACVSDAPTGRGLELSSEVLAAGIVGWVDAAGAGFLDPEYRGVANFETLEVRVQAVTEEPDFEPTFILLALTAQAHGWTHAHAAAVRLRDGRRALMVGTSQAGKSTSMIALALNGARWGTDDAVFIQQINGALRTVSLPRSFMVRPRTIEAFPEVRQNMWLEQTPAGPRQLVDPVQLFGARPEFEWDDIDVLLLPQVMDQTETTLHRVDPAEAMMKCLPDCAWGALEHLPRHLDALGVVAALAARPAYAMHLGRRVLTDPASLADAIEAHTR
jgi:hypothetical protein